MTSCKLFFKQLRLSYYHLELNLGLFLTGCIDAMVSYRVEKIMIRHLFDTVTVASIDGEW